MKVCEVIECQMSYWYNIFKEITFKSEIIDLPDEVIRYLLADGLVLPKGCDAHLTSSGFQDSDDEQNEWETEIEDEAKRPDFPQLNKSIENSIKKLGGKVFPKLNWSSPKDASWISLNGSLECTCAGDVYLLLKSSGFCTHDLIEPFSLCSDYSSGQQPAVTYQLALRRWTDIHPSAEFRAFVRNQRLIAISQRHHSSHYDFLSEQTADIVHDLTHFYQRHLRSKLSLNNVVFDVYRKEQGKIYLVDLNPYGEVTDPLLFTWDQLNAIPESQPAVLRLVECAGVQPSPLAQYGMPLDIQHLTTGADASKLLDLLRLNENVQNHSSTDEDV